MSSRIAVNVGKELAQRKPFLENITTEELLEYFTGFVPNETCVPSSKKGK